MNSASMFEGTLPFDLAWKIYFISVQKYAMQGGAFVWIFQIKKFLHNVFLCMITLVDMIIFPQPCKFNSTNTVQTNSNFFRGRSYSCDFVICSYNTSHGKIVDEVQLRMAYHII